MMGIEKNTLQRWCAGWKEVKLFLKDFYNINLFSRPHVKIKMGKTIKMYEYFEIKMNF